MPNEVFLDNLNVRFWRRFLLGLAIIFVLALVGTALYRSYQTSPRPAEHTSVVPQASPREKPVLFLMKLDVYQYYMLIYIRLTQLRLERIYEALEVCDYRVIGDTLHDSGDIHRHRKLASAKHSGRQSAASANR